MNEDLNAFLSSLRSHKVEFLVIGAHAVGFYSRPRMTEDFDVWVSRSMENALRLQSALDEFGMPIGADGARRFAELDRQMVRLGVPPNMIDVLNFAGSEPFEEVYARRVPGDIDGVALEFPAKEDLIAMKRHSGRPQDLADIVSLEKLA